jgi:polar amino acid transport system permease protein
LTALASAVVVIGGLTALVVTSPGWPRVQATFFSWSDARATFPSLGKAFVVNIELFVVAEPLILALALLVALVRGSRSPAMAPFRRIAVVYTDLFRGIPTLLLIYLIGFGVPALRLRGTPDSLFVLSLVALVLSYGAYVSEVLRAGIDSVHPSQRAAARSLGLTQGQTTRTVVLPQAVRRVAPPLLNDFVSLQKDTALVSVLGTPEILQTANIYSSYHFNYTSLVVAACFFVVLTVPLTRLTDWLGRRALRRQQWAGAV